MAKLVPEPERSRHPARSFAVPLAWLTVWLTVPFALFECAPPQPDLHERPGVTARPLPRLTEVDRLDVAASDELPAFRAARARPAPSGREFLGLQLPGAGAVFELEDVELMHPESGATVRAAGGRWSGDRLELRELEVSLDGAVRLQAAGAELRAGVLACRGPTLSWTHPEARRTTLSPRVPWADLLAWIEAPR